MRLRATAWPARLVLLGAIWGMSFVLIKIGNRGFTPVQVSFGRMLFGLLALAPVLLAQRGRLPRDARTWLHLAVAAVLVNSAPFTLFAFGEQHVSSLLAGIWNGTTPLFVLVVVLLTLPEERPTRERALGLALGFAGVLVVLGAWRGIGRGELVGSAACLSAAILYGIGFPYLRRYLATGGLTVPVLAFGQLAMGTLQLALVLPFAGGLPAGSRPVRWRRSRRSAPPERAPRTCSTTRLSGTRARPRPPRSPTSCPCSRRLQASRCWASA